MGTAARSAIREDARIRTMTPRIFSQAELYDLPRDKAILLSVKAIILESGKALLLHSTDAHLHWELPGGLVDLRENLEDGLKREVREETTLEIEIGKILGVGDMWRLGFRFKDGTVRDIRVIEIIYQCRKLSESIALSKEHDKYRWATKDDMASLQMFPQHQSAAENALASH